MNREEKLIVALKGGAKKTLKQLSEETGYPEASVSCGLRVLRNVHNNDVCKECVGDRTYAYFIMHQGGATVSESATPRTDAAPRLTPDEINRRIALACGWKWLGEYSANASFNDLISPCRKKTHRIWIWRAGWTEGDSLPNYFASLDACAEFEATLDERAELFYMTRLVEAMALSGTIGTKKDRTYRATAPQRCHAFCLMRGLIKDGEEWPE